MSEKNKWELWKEKYKVTPLDLINPNTEMVEDPKAEYRYSICKTCPEFINLTKQCKKCGCFMAVKTKIEQAVCPIGKW